MKRSLIALLIIALIVAAIFYGSPFYMPGLLSAAVSKQLGAEVEVTKASLCLGKGIIAQGITITNSKGLQCSVENATMGIGRRSFLPLIKERILFFPLELKNVRFQSSGSSLVGSITEAMGFKQLESLLFDTAGGELYFKSKEVMLKGIEVSGEHIKLYIDGTIVNDNLINCSFRILLSDELLASIPESRRKFFFKQDGSSSKVELYLSGDIERPAINFSTDLFKLSIR